MDMTEATRGTVDYGIEFKGVSEEGRGVDAISNNVSKAQYIAEE